RRHGRKGAYIAHRRSGPRRHRAEVAGAAHSAPEPHSGRAVRDQFRDRAHRERQNLFEEACRIAVEHGGFELAWIGTVNPGTMEIMPVASAGAEAESFLAQSRSFARAGAQLGGGITGRAVREKRAVYSNDLLQEPTLGGERRKEALRRG